MNLSIEYTFPGKLMLCYLRLIQENLKTIPGSISGGRPLPFCWQLPP